MKQSLNTHAAAWTAVVTLMLGGTAYGQAANATVYEADQSVEVREGDTWSAAKVVKKEGRRYQIRYDDGTEEWVASDRLRKAGTAGPAAGDKPGAEKADEKAATDKPAAGAVRAFTPQQAVQVKWGGSWWDARIEKRNKDWYFVSYSSDQSKEWVQHWRVRKPGDAYDVGHAQPTGKRDANKPPTEPAGEATAPFGPRRNAGGKADAPPRPNAPVVDEKAFVEANRKAGRAVVPALAPAWRYTPPTEGAVKLFEQPVSIDHNASDAMEKEPELVINGGFVGVMRSCDFFDRKWTRLEIIDLKAGTSIWKGELPPKSRVLAIASDGKQAVTRSGENGQRLELWKLEGEKPTLAMSFAPYAGAKGGNKDVEWAAFPDPTTVLTTNRDGTLACWTVDKASMRWEISPGGMEFHNKSPAISPDGKTIALSTEIGLLMLRTADGAVIASIPTKVSGAISMSPDGKRLIAVTNGSVQSFDLTTGKVGQRMGLPKGAKAANGIAIREDIVWLDGTVLDMAALAPIAQYEGGSSLRAVGGQLIGLAGGQGKSGKALCTWQLPGPDMKPAAGGVVNLAKGARIALDIQLGDGESDQKARDALTKQLTARGAEIGDGGVRICARIETGESKTETYETFGGAPWDRVRENVTFTPKTTRLYIESNGKNLWEISSYSGASGMVQRKQGQSFQDAITQSIRANPALVINATIPDVVLEADASSLPQFKLVPGGAQPK